MHRFPKSAHCQKVQYHNNPIQQLVTPLTLMSHQSSHHICCLLTVFFHSMVHFPTQCTKSYADLNSEMELLRNLPAILCFRNSAVILIALIHITVTIYHRVKAAISAHGVFD